MSVNSNFIQELLYKLNHPIEEVRSRALRNINNKIERNIIDVSDLCRYEEFIPYLLQWFNYDVVRNQDLVVSMLERVSQTQNGIKCLICTGGVEFLSQLKLDTKNTDIKLSLENILVNIFKGNCYQDEHDLASSVQKPIVYMPKSQNTNDQQRDKTSNGYHQSIGYFNDESNAVDNDNRNSYGNVAAVSDIDEIEEDDAFRLCVYPIIPLTNADKVVLNGSLSTLKSGDFRVVLSGIQFFSDVILEDFPAPVFLQRQGALQLLIEFLSHRQYSVASVRCLMKFCQKLSNFIDNFLDPNFFSSKNAYRIVKECSEDYEEFSSMSDHLLNLNYDVNTSIPLQLPAPVFALQIISVALQQFIEINTDLNWVEYLKLICVSIKLLRKCLCEDLKKLYVWQPWNITTILADQFDLWAKLLLQYSVIEDLHCRHLSNNRLIYVNIFSIFWDWVSNLFSPANALKFLPGNCKVELCRALFDKSIWIFLENRLTLLVDYVKLFDQNLYNAYIELCNVIKSSESLVQFFLHCNEPIKFAEICVSKAFESLDCLDHIHGQRFTKDFIHFFSLICSTEIFKDKEDLFSKCDEIVEKLITNGNPSISKTVFVEIFDITRSHVNIEELSKPKSGSERKINFILRPRIFQLLIIWGLYSKVSEVRETTAALFCKLWDSQGLLPALYWRKVMEVTWEHMVLTQPLADGNTRIGRNIINLAFTTSTTPMNSKLEANSNELTKSNKITDLLPLMFNKNSDVRKETSQQLEQILLFNANGTWDCQVKISSIADFLVSIANENKKDRLYKSCVSNQNKIQEADNVNFQKVIDIFSTDSVDISVRKSAAEQIAIFLQMPNMHAYFISHGGLHYILDLLKGKLLDKSRMTILAPSTVLILLRVVQHKTEIRDSLKKDHCLLDNLIRMALYFCYDKQCVADISIILSLLFFNSFIKQDPSEYELRVLDVIANNVILPFVYLTFSYNKPNTKVSVLNEICELSNEKWLLSDSLKQNLRIHWNITKHGGLNNYIAYKYSFFGKQIVSAEDNSDLIDEILSESEKLFLSENDKYVFENSVPQMILCDHFNRIQNATNHCQVHTSLVSIDSIITVTRYQTIDNNISVILNNTSFWLENIKRFLLNIPSCSADYVLLELVMDVLESIMKLPDASSLDDVVKWMAQILTNSNNPLIFCLQKGDKIIGKTDSRRLTLAKSKIELRLPQFFASLLKFFNFHIVIGKIDHDVQLDILNILKLTFELSIQNLQQHSKSPFNNLGMLLKWLTLTYTCLEINIDAYNEIVERNISDYFDLCSNIIVKFQENREEGSITFMGSGALLRLLRLLLSFISYCDNIQTTAPFDSLVYHTNWLRKTPWLLELIGYRTTDIRAIALALINKLVLYDNFRGIIFQHCSELLPESLWSVALTIFLDISEAPVVRSEAMAILQNLSVSVSLNNSLELAYSEIFSNPTEKDNPIFVDTHSAIQFTGIEGLYKILLYQDFFRNVGIILTNLYTYPVIIYSRLRRRPLYDPESHNNLSKTANDAARQKISESDFALSTPLMVSATIAFLSNLYFYIPTQLSSQFSELRINTILMNLIDPNLLKVYLQRNEIKNLSKVLDLISTYKNCIKLIRLQIASDSSFRDSFLIDEKFVKTIIKIFLESSFQNNCKIGDIWKRTLSFSKTISDLQVEITVLLIALIVPTPLNDHIQLLLTHLISELDGVLSCIKQMLNDESKKCSMTAMQFLCLFLSLDFKCSQPNSLVLAMERETINLDKGPPIIELTELLMKKREKLSTVFSKNQGAMDRFIAERHSVQNTLKILLGVSGTVKGYILKIGFIESCLVEIKYLHAKLDQSALTVENNKKSQKTIHSVDKPNLWKSILREIISVLELLQNLFFHNSVAQDIAASVGFPNVVYRLWTLALLDSNLLHSILNCFMNYSANSQRAIKSLVNCHQSSHSVDQPPSVGSSLSIIENLCRLTTADLNSYQLRKMTTMLTFRLLSNLMWSPEAVTVFMRLRFLDKFEHINPNQLQKTSAGVGLQNVWLNLLTSLSFTEDGQNAIMKSNGAGILKVLKAQNSINAFKSASLLIIRNLCTHPVIKLKLVVDGSDLVNNIIQCLNSNNMNIHQLSLSTLKALAYSNNKIRVYLKSTNLLLVLMNLREHYENDANGCLLLPDIIMLINVFQDCQESKMK